MSRVATISAQLVLDSKRFDRTIKRVQSNFKKLASDSRAQAAAAGAALGAMAVGLGNLTSELANAGDGAVKLRKDLSAAFEGQQLDDLTKQVRELGATPPFSEQQFANGAKALQKFEREVSQNLVRIGNAAVETGESFDSISKAYAGFGKDSRATAQLEKLLGIDSADLVKFGAVLDKTGEKLSFVGDDAIKAQQALERFADDKYSGAMDKVVTESEKLRGEWQLLKEDLGIGLSELGDSAAEVFLPLVSGLRDTSDGTKKLIGLGVGVAGFAAAFGAAAIGIGLIGVQVAASVTAAGGLSVVLGAISAGATTAATAVGGFALALAPVAVTAGAVALALGSVAYAIYSVDQALKDSVKIEEEALAIELKRAAGQKTLSDLIGKSGKELRDQGKTAADATNGILALQQRIELATQAGNTALVERLKKQVVELKQARGELAELERGDRLAAKERAAEEAKTPEQRAAEARQKALDAELHQIALRLATEEITQKESLALRAEALDRFRADEEKKRALVLETARFETAERKKAKDDGDDQIEKDRAKKLQRALDFIQLEKAANRLSTEEEIKALDRVLAHYDLTEQEKRNLTLRTAQLRRSVRDAEAAEEKKRAEKAKADADKVAKDLEAQAKTDADTLARLQDRARAQQVAQKDREISNLGSEEGVDNTTKIQAALKDRLKLQVESLRAEADRAKAATKNADVIAQIEANLQRDIRAEIQRTAEEERDALQAQYDARKKLADDTKKLSGEDDRQFDVGYGIEELSERLTKELNTTTRRRGSDDLGIEPPELEAIERQLELEVTKVTAQAPALEAAIANLATQISSLPKYAANAAAYPTQATPAAVATGTAGGARTVNGQIDLNVTVDGEGRPKIDTVATTGFNGRYSEISKQARGMRGSVSLA